jgi:hypothetical protein
MRSEATAHSKFLTVSTLPLHSTPRVEAPGVGNWSNRLWVLKKSLSRNARKLDRVRMPYKRFSPISDTFLVTPFGSVFRQIEFFNHACLQQLIQLDPWQALRL